MEIEELKKRIREKSLVIGRLPKQTRQEFLDLADAMFCSDYGFTLKFLLDEYKKSQIYDYLASKLFELEQAINKMNIPQTEEIKTLSGKKIKREVRK